MPVFDAAPRFPIRIYWQAASWHKVPRLKGWQQHATNDPAKIEWWHERYGPNFGIHLGTALVAIDADRHGVDGVAALHEIARGRDWPPHPIVATAGGGEHHIFRQPRAPLGQGKGALPGGIDVRGDGGWIIAPGSRRPDGREWTLMVDVEPPVLPIWLELLIRAKATHTHRAPSFHATQLSSGPNDLPKPLYTKLLCLVPLSVTNRRGQRRVRGILLTALWWQHKGLTQCNGAHRNEGLFWATNRLRELGFVDRAVAVELLIDVVKLNGYLAKDGLEAVERTIESGWPEAFDQGSSMKEEGRMGGCGMHDELTEQRSTR
jgi:Bifunctional DNA primase/polymerase, N-terminal